jgi:uncharacterized protein (TIGR02266 family)
MSRAAARAAELRSAREARGLLSEALSQLERAGLGASAVPSLGYAIQALQQFETDEAAAENSRHLKNAVKALGEALRLLQTGDTNPALDNGVESVARTLALLYPLARTQQRRRKRAVLELAEGDATLEPEPESTAAAPPAPEPTGHKPEPQNFSGENKRSHGDRMFAEVDIGLLSESHFYTGLSRDISRGGVFIATYQPQPPGTHMTLYFVLPSGRAVQAKGVVRWTSEGRGDVAPGMGVAFEDVSEDDAQAILEFCEARTPLYHDSADD